LSEDLRELSTRLEVIEDQIRDLTRRLSQLESQKDFLGNSAIASQDLLNLPDSLRKTMMAMIQLEEASAKAIATETHRTRGMESIYLNQLVRLGYLEKIKRGRNIYFRTLRLI
jgi:predicted transcriptional regulator